MTDVFFSCKSRKQGAQTSSWSFRLRISTKIAAPLNTSGIHCITIAQLTENKAITTNASSAHAFRLPMNRRASRAQPSVPRQSAHQKSCQARTTSLFGTNPGSHSILVRGSVRQKIPILRRLSVRHGKDRGDAHRRIKDERDSHESCYSAYRQS